MAPIRLCFLLFCLSLASVSSYRLLKNLNDLRQTGYANRAPRIGLRLLSWFAQNMNIDNNNIMRLNYNPAEGVYGSHLFRNIDNPRLLPLYGRHINVNYYSVGNLNINVYPRASELPLYVRDLYSTSSRNLPEANMDRLIVSVNQDQPNRVLRVFVTSHNRGRQDFNSSDTHEIDPALLSAIRQPDVCPTVPLTESERCKLFLQQMGYSTSCQGLIPRLERSLDSQCEAIKLQIKSTTQGYSKLTWTNIPDNVFRFKVYIDMCQNTYSSDANDAPTQAVKQSVQISKSTGSSETSVFLNAGLQPRLRLSSSDVFWYGSEVEGSRLIRIKGFDASLQLCAANGKACARLYIKNTFSNWKSVFSSSWVGFYRRSYDNNENYDKYEYITKFAKLDKTAAEDYDVYQYNSSLTIAPGVQIRFLLDDKYDKVLAQTTPWERDEEEPSAWTFPEFFFQPHFYDANNVLPVKIGTYDAGLQLFTEDGKACARLYIRKSFNNWKIVFKNSWVGFYASSQDKNNKYDAYKYAKEFEKEVGVNENFDIYQYKSGLTIAPGVQIRFQMENGYDTLLVETEPWKSA